jgi:hypothetical protein
MTASELLGVAGFCIALFTFVVTAAHIAWQVWWQHRQEKELVRVVIAMEPKLHVLVHNVGVVPVYLTGVELVADERRIPLLAVVRLQALPTEIGKAGTEVWQATGRKTYLEPLQRGDAHPFVLLEVLPQLPKKAYISVTSNAGVIRRLKGKPLARMLEALAKS